MLVDGIYSAFLARKTSNEFERKLLEQQFLEQNNNRK